MTPCRRPGHRSLTGDGIGRYAVAAHREDLANPDATTATTDCEAKRWVPHGVRSDSGNHAPSRLGHD